MAHHIVMSVRVTNPRSMQLFVSRLNAFVFCGGCAATFFLFPFRKHLHFYFNLFIYINLLICIEVNRCVCPCILLVLFTTN